MNAANPLRILLVEDDELFRLGLSTRLERESQFKIVAEAIDGESAIALANQSRPDIVLMDVGLPGIGGVEACRRFSQRYPDLPVLVLTSHSKRSLIDELINAGADGFCLKGIEAEALILALKSVAAGASWWDQESTSEIRATFTSKPFEGEDPSDSLEHHLEKSPTCNPVQQPAQKSISAIANTADKKGFRPVLALTEREQEVLTLIAKGQNNQEIAETLTITVGTVRVHTHAILQKLAVRDRTQAAIFALQRGLV